MREQYIQKDAEIWTTALAQYPGFLGKEVWINPEAPAEVVLVIRWANREAWKSVPADMLEQTEKRFAQEFDGPYELIGEAEYQIRKFPSYER